MLWSGHEGSDGEDGGNSGIEGRGSLIIWAHEHDGLTHGVQDLSNFTLAVLACSDFCIHGVGVGSAGSSGVLADERLGGAVITLSGGFLGGGNGNDGGKCGEFHF